MGKTIKVIDLIIAISKKEKVPYKIEFDGKKMVYDGNKQDYFGYYSNGNGEWLFQYLFDRCKNTGGFINKFVKIIEEDKEIELKPIEEFNISYNLGFVNYRNVEILKDYLNKDFQTIYDTLDLLIKNQKILEKLLNELKKGK